MNIGPKSQSFPTLNQNENYNQNFAIDSHVENISVVLSEMHNGKMFMFYVYNHLKLGIIVSSWSLGECEGVFYTLLHVTKSHKHAYNEGNTNDYKYIWHT